MIALLLSLVATMSGAGVHAAAAPVGPAATVSAPFIPVIKPMTAHPLAG